MSDDKKKFGCCQPKVETKHDHPNAIAILRTNGHVDVYDVKGKVRSFATDQTDAAHICFSTHGLDMDQLLTPCFDENGEHGEPKMTCFCGLKEPHLHAHVHDEQRCMEVKKGDKDRIHDLAHLTLHRIESDKVQISLLESESLPNACNSKELKHIISAGGSDAQSLYDKHREASTVFNVQHTDHVDKLVHNSKTGNMTLEHDCGDCGEHDVHGTLELISKRTWKTDTTTERRRMNFYAVPETPLKLLDMLADFFSMDGDRASILRNSFPAQMRRDMEKKKSCCSHPCCGKQKSPCCEKKKATCCEKKKSPCCRKKSIAPNRTTDHAAKSLNGASEVSRSSGKSSFFVSGICCASEIPAINSILEPLKGVEKVSINVTSKTVYVEHEFALMSASGIKEALDKEKFEARIIKDAEADDQRARATVMSKYVETTLLIPSLLGSSDANKMQQVLRSNFSKDHLSHSETHVPSKTIKVDHNPQLLSTETLMDFLKKEGFDVQLIADGFAEGIWSAGQEEEIAEDAVKLDWNVALSGVFWIVSMLHLVDTEGNWDYLKYTAFVSVLLGIPKIAQKAFATMKRRQFDTNCMMLFATLGALALQEYVEAAAVTFLFSISDWLETISTARARIALSAIVRLQPDRAKVKDPNTSKFVYVPANDVAVGSIVSVRTGDKIPCDGIVIEGRSVVDESSLTGESRPVQKSPDSLVSGGTINAGLAQLLVKTTSTADDSAVAKLIRLVEEAQANRSPTEKLIDEFAKRYTPVVVLLALSMCTFPWIVSREAGREWTKMGLVTIVIACPCALIISTPVTYVAGLAAAAQRGIIVKGGAHLESLGRVTKIAMDKTGTLTEGNFKLLHLRSWGELSRNEAFQYIFAMEAHASHPLAAAIIAAAKAENVSIPESWKIEDHQNLEGEGVKAIVNGKVVHVGNFRLFERLALINMLPTEEIEAAKVWLGDGSTVGFMSIEGYGIVASYCVADAIRKEAKDVVAKFRKLGIDVNMLTGDNAKAASTLGERLGLTPGQIKSNLLPDEKLKLVKQMMDAETEAAKKKSYKRAGLVLMCGDGVNDAPALALADVGVAMGAGAALAMETADVTLLDSNLEKLLKVVSLGKKVTRTIIENVCFSFFVKAIVMGFTFAGYSSLWAAIGSDVVAMLAVTLNGMKLLPSKKSVRSGSGFDSWALHNGTETSKGGAKEDSVASFPLGFPQETNV